MIRNASLLLIAGCVAEAGTPVSVAPSSVRGEPYDLKVAEGTTPGTTVVHKFGRNPTVSTTEELVDGLSTAFSSATYFRTSATAVRVKAGGNAADDSGGAGARKIKVVCLDENFAQAEEEITLAGASASSPTTITCIRLFRAYVTESGTYAAEVPTGNVVIENAAGGTDLATIRATTGQTEIASYTIPAGKTGYIRQTSVRVASGKSADVYFWQKMNAHDTSAPYTNPQRLISQFPELDGDSRYRHETWDGFPEYTDLFWTAKATSTETDVSVEWEMVLVDN